MHQVDEGFDDLPIHIVCVVAEVAFVEGVSDVVWTVAQEGQQSRVIEVLVAGVADEPGSQLLEVAQKGVETLVGSRPVIHR